MAKKAGPKLNINLIIADTFFSPKYYQLQAIVVFMPAKFLRLA
jgi:hypothetical protein